MEICTNFQRNIIKYVCKRNNKWYSRHRGGKTATFLPFLFAGRFVHLLRFFFCVCVSCLLLICRSITFVHYLPLSFICLGRNTQPPHISLLYYFPFIFLFHTTHFDLAEISQECDQMVSIALTFGPAKKKERKSHIKTHSVHNYIVSNCPGSSTVYYLPNMERCRESGRKVHKMERREWEREWR